MYRRRGLGADIDSEGNITYPWYCSSTAQQWFFPLLTANATAACAPPTTAQLQQAQQNQLSQIAAQNPAAAAAALAAGNATQQSYATANPADYANEQAAANSPAVYAFGGQWLASLASGQNPDTGQPLVPQLPNVNWLLVGGAVAAVAVLLLVRR